MTMSNGSVKQIQNVMHVLVIKKNSIFVSIVAYEYMEVEFVKSRFLMKDMQDHYKVIATGGRVGGLYNLDVMMNSHQALTSTTMSIEVLWNIRYGHLDYNDLLLLQRQEMVDGIPSLKNEHASCEGCALGKKKRKEFPTHIEKRRGTSVN